MGQPKAVTADNFKSEILSSKTPVIVDFWAPWCGPCKIMEPVLNELCSEYEDKFGFKPKFHISGFSNYIKVNFRLTTLDSANFFKYQPEFAKKVYHIVHD